MDAFVSRTPRNTSRVAPPTLTQSPRRQGVAVSVGHDDAIVKCEELHPGVQPRPATKEPRKRKRQDHGLLLADEVGQKPHTSETCPGPPFVPRQFWCHKTDEWSHALPHPARGGTAHDQSPLYPAQRGMSWFGIASTDADGGGNSLNKARGVVDAVRVAATAKAAEDQAALDLARTRRPQSKKARTRPRKEDKAPAGKTRRIRIYPDARQKAVLREWMSTARWTYNKCVEFLRTESSKPKKDRLAATESRLRDLYVVQKGLGLSSAPDSDPLAPRKKGRPKGSTTRAGKVTSASATRGLPARAAAVIKRRPNRMARRSQGAGASAPSAVGQTAACKKEKAARRRAARAVGRLKRTNGCAVSADAHMQGADGDLSWVASTPHSIRVAAVAEFVVAHRANVAKSIESGGKHRFDMSFRARKDPTECITIPSQDWARKSGVFASILSPKVLRAARGQVLPDTIDYVFNIVRDTRHDHYYLCLPMPVDVIKEPPSTGPLSAIDGDRAAPVSGPAAGVIALDPGVRTFLAGYTDSGTAVEIGRGSDKRLKRLMAHHDDLRSIIDKGTNDGTIRHHKRYRMEKALARMRLRARNLIEEVHKKAARWLCENHRYILIPKFETARMTARRSVAPAVRISTGEAATGNPQMDSTTGDTRAPPDPLVPAVIIKPRCRGRRCISRRTARSMYAWAHCRFRERLIHKASQYGWCSVVTVREDYTSKTCGACGRLTDVGSSDVFRCAHDDCAFVGGRDRNAARNVLLRFLTEHYPSTSSPSTPTSTHGILAGEGALETGSPEQGHGGMSSTPAK